ncbi:MULTISPECIES: hypothetical protein [unclassified Pseudoalteromonas]|uniref:hypothetical protein n=1 Tax=unclassified Pseudoalteromonas TaxID=194690 RepID=UPI0005A7C868|nr:MULTISPECIES: hypothetical protein [unclassified Pseudoalteromonas]
MNIISFIITIVVIATFLAWLWLKLEKSIIAIFKSQKESALIIVLRMFFICFPTVLSANLYFSLFGDPF